MKWTNDHINDCKTIIPRINYFIGIYTSAFNVIAQRIKCKHVLFSFFPITYIKIVRIAYRPKSSFTLSAIAFLLLQMRVFYIDNVLCIVITLSRLQGIIVVLLFLERFITKFISALWFYLIVF